MVSTVTTSTVTAVTTATLGLTAGLTLLAILTLLSLLIPKEIASMSDRVEPKSLSRALDVALVPLLLTFAFIAVIRVMEVLN